MDERFIVLNFDTTGFIKYKEITPETLKHFPYIVRIDYEYIDGKNHWGNQITIKLPEGVRCSEETLSYNGLTLDDIGRGHDRESTMLRLVHMIRSAAHIVYHNASYHHKILQAELTRWGYDIDVNCPIEDTMLNGMSVCQIPSAKEGEYKYPRLSELAEKLGITESERKAQTIAECLLRMKEQGYC